MRVFVTGAAGFIGQAVVGELVANGHRVLGLARSDGNADILARAGADVLEGSLQDVESLKRGASAADGVIHLAFIHDFTKFAENGAIDKAAIEAMGGALRGSDKPFIVTSGTNLVAPGVVATEDMRRPMPSSPRVSEQAGLAFAAQGVRAMAIRLPQVHGAPGKAGLFSYFFERAKQTGRPTYVGDGGDRWAAAHRSDVARLYRLALENGTADAIYHAVGEEGVPMRQVADVFARILNSQPLSIAKSEAAEHFGPLAMFAGMDMPASSDLTRRRLDWTPAGPGLIADISRPGYFTV